MRDRPRYLTPAEKAKELSYWAELKQQPRPARPDFGGRGYPDPEIFDICDRLNAIPGVCTLQSCAGHGPEEAENGCTYPGLLWIWLDEPTARAFEREVSDFQRIWHPVIERVGKHWQPDGQEVVEIVFARHDQPEFARATLAIILLFQLLGAPRASDG